MQWEIRINPKKSAKVLNDEVRLMDMILEAEKTGVRPDTLYFKNPFGGNNLDYSHFKDLQSCRDRWDDVEELILRKNVVMHSYVATVGRNYEGYVKFLKRWKCDRSIISEENFNKWCDRFEWLEIPANEKVNLSIRRQGTTSTAYTPAWLRK